MTFNPKLSFDETDQKNLDKIWRSNLRQINEWADMLVNEGGELKYPRSDRQNTILDRAKKRGFPKGVVVAAAKILGGKSGKPNDIIAAYKEKIGLELAA